MNNNDDVILRIIKMDKMKWIWMSNIKKNEKNI